MHSIDLQAEDFLDPAGKVCLIREELSPSAQRNESGILSSLYSYIALSGVLKTFSSGFWDDQVGLLYLANVDLVFSLHQLKTDHRLDWEEYMLGFCITFYLTCSMKIMDTGHDIK